MSKNLVRYQIGTDIIGQTKFVTHNTKEKMGKPKKKNNINKIKTSQFKQERTWKRKSLEQSY